MVGKSPNIDTFGLILDWLDIDPSYFFGLEGRLFDSEKLIKLKIMEALNSLRWGCMTCYRHGQSYSAIIGTEPFYQELFSVYDAAKKVCENYRLFFIKQGKCYGEPLKLAVKNLQERIGDK